MQVGFEIHEGVALITMDDGKKNAITPTAAQEILAALEDAEANAGALVLAGRPGAFCAGFDLATMTSGDMESIASLATGGARILFKLYSMGMPLVAAGTGHAFTIGALWLLACDTRIGERGSYKFGMNETVMGMVLPDWALEVLKAPSPYRRIDGVSRVSDFPENGRGTRGRGFRLAQCLPCNGHFPGRQPKQGTRAGKARHVVASQRLVISHISFPCALLRTLS